jgi:ADP-ribose pyrophosphatase YjhB (NUDIX family)
VKLLTKFKERFFSHPDRITIGVQAAVFDQDGRVLLVRHGYRPGWHFPGGGVERGESLTEALARELLEETGLATDEAPRLFGLYAHFDDFPGDHIALFVIERWRRDHVPLPNKEIAEQRFFDPSGVPPDTSEGSRRRLVEIAEGRPPDLTW